MADIKIKPGMTTTVRKEVSAMDAYSTITGPLEFLLSTPAIMTMVIEASTKMLDSELSDDLITVGKHIDLFHLKPTLVGEGISITLTVKSLEKDVVLMEVVVNDRVGTVARGIYERAIVSRNKLMDTAYARSEAQV